MRRLMTVSVLAATALVLGGCHAGRSGVATGDASSKVVSMSPKAELAVLKALMIGSFSSEAQAAADPDFRDIRLHMAEIWPGSSPHGAWLYVEQSTAQAQDRPYRQRVYWVTTLPFKSAEGQTQLEFRSEVWQLPGDAKTFTGGWKDPAKFAGIKPSDLTEKEGCAVILRKTSLTTYDGGTVGNGCPSELQGATYATSIVHIDPTGLRTWDRGHNAVGEQVWGATKGGYEFKRVDAR
jgi:CpeT protein